MMDTLRVSEIFKSIQGEGPAAGRSATFVRLSGCNLSCSWCDTPYTWDIHRNAPDESALLSVDAILTRLGDARIVVLTGGEPLLQQHQPALRALIDSLPGHCAVHVETNGTIEPTAKLINRVAVWMVSPKLSNAGVHRGRQNPSVHPFWSRTRLDSAHLKIVCTDQSAARQAVQYADSLSWPHARVWLMPEGTDIDTVLTRWPAIADAAVELGVNATQRLHVLAWGKARGK